MITNKLRNLNDDIDDQRLINIAPETKIYTGSNGVTMKYIDDDDIIGTIFIAARSHVVFDDNIRIFSLNNDLYVATDERAVSVSPEDPEENLSYLV
jgi:hypothetical protein